MEQTIQKKWFAVVQQLAIFSEQHGCPLLRFTQSCVCIWLAFCKVKAPVSWRVTVKQIQCVNMKWREWRWGVGVSSEDEGGMKKQTEIALGNVCEVLPDGSQESRMTRHRCITLLTVHWVAHFKALGMKTSIESTCFISSFPGVVVGGTVPSFIWRMREDAWNKFYLYTVLKGTQNTTHPHSTSFTNRKHTGRSAETRQKAAELP